MTRKLAWLVTPLLLAFVHLAQAQQPKKLSRIGYLSSFDPASDSAPAEGIRLALRDLGYVEGQNIATDYRYAEGSSIGSLSLRPSRRGGEVVGSEASPSPWLAVG